MTPHSQPVGAPERVWIGVGDSERKIFQYFSLEKVYPDDLEYARVLVHPMPQGIAEAIARHQEIIHNLCHGEKWTMRIPANPKLDHDIVLGESMRTLVAALEATAQRLALMESQLPRVWTAETIGDAPDGQYWCFSPPYKKQKGYWNVFPFTLNQETKWNVTEGVYPKVHGPLPVTPIEGQVR